MQVHPRAKEQDGNKISLELQTVFDKLVTRKRGGYCFEQNTLVAAVLTTMGFRYHPSQRDCCAEMRSVERGVGYCHADTYLTTDSVCDLRACHVQVLHHGSALCA